MVLGACSSAPDATRSSREHTASSTGALADAAVGSGMADDGDGPRSLPPPAIKRGALTGAELARLAKTKPPSQPPPQPSNGPVTDAQRTAVALAKAAALPGDGVVRLLVQLQAPSFAFSALAGVDDATHASLIEQRKQQLAPGQDAVAKAVAALGASEVGRLWLGGSGLVVDTAASAVPQIAALSTVRFVEVQEAGGESHTAQTLGAGRALSAMRTQGLIDGGFDSGVNGRVNHASPMRIALIEHDSANVDYLEPNHPGLRKYAGGPTRVQRQYRCTSYCSEVSVPPPVTNRHGMGVASASAGSITDGQDPNYPGSNTPGSNTQAQIDRSGHAPKADIYYYSEDQTPVGQQAALQQAVADGADVINMSWGWGACNPTEDHATFNAALFDAREAGALLVASVGNSALNLSDTCKVTWPATRPDVLAVGGLCSLIPTQYVDYDLAVAANCYVATALGGLPITSHGGSGFSATAIGLTAPGQMRVLLDVNNGYTSFSPGSSVAAPQVAGAAAGLRDAFRSLGWPDADDASAIYTNMLLMGDAWDGNNVPWPGDSVRQRIGANRRSGHGRTRMRWPLSRTGMLPPWGWESIPLAVYDAQWVTIDIGDIPTGISEFKVVATWFPWDLSDVSDVDMEVWNTTTNTCVAFQNDYDYHNRIRVNGSEVAGAHLQLKLHGWSVRLGGEAVYVAWMYHSGAP